MFSASGSSASYFQFWRDKNSGLYKVSSSKETGLQEFHRDPARNTSLEYSKDPSHESVSTVMLSGWTTKNTDVIPPTGSVT